MSLRVMVLACVFLQCSAPPVTKSKSDAATVVATKNTQDNDYHRYLADIVEKLLEDEEFKKKIHNLTENDIKSGKILEHIDLLDHEVRRKLDEVKRKEINHQHKLIKKKRLHMLKEKRNDWNPIHDDNQETFEQEDFQRLINKHHRLNEESDKERKKQFKVYLMGKEHKRRLLMKNMTEAQKNEYKKHYNQSKHKKHEKLYAPGRKAQLIEAWEKEDNLDPEAFDEKTMFHLHDKNGDGYLDDYEMETFFLNDINKVYNESDPEIEVEREEELERMREGILKTMDEDGDGMISFNEFTKEKNDTYYDRDQEWNPIDEDEEYTDEEMNKYEKEHPDEEEHYDEHHEPRHDIKGDLHETKDEHHEASGSDHRESEKSEHHESAVNDHHQQAKKESKL